MDGIGVYNGIGSVALIFQFHQRESIIQFQIAALNGYGSTIQSHRYHFEDQNIAVFILVDHHISLVK